jgi:4'-phosphopantetheinyl transferase EntD
VITPILPEMTVAAELFGDIHECALFSAEAKLVENAVGKRRREFVSGRACAHRALAALGLPPSPVLAGTRGEPLWPRGVVGSITHCAGYRACAVASAAEVAALGIDAEPHRPLPAGVLAAISSPGERERLRETFATDPPIHWDRLLFCVKEAIYKAWYPRTGAPLGFDDMEIEFDPARRRFAAAVKRSRRAGQPRCAANFSGRWRVGRGLVVVSSWSR